MEIGKKVGLGSSTIFDADISDEMARLAELQENSARNDLTGVQRKYYASEIGRLIAKMSENSDSASRNNQWIIEIAKTSNTPLRTIYNWWKAFCQETGCPRAPRVALDADKEVFFTWLEEQNRQAEKARQHLAQVKAEEARRERQDKEYAQVIRLLGQLIAAYGFPDVQQRLWAFLTQDGTCGIYPARPSACRTYYSLSREACERYFFFSDLDGSHPVLRGPDQGLGGMLTLAEVLATRQPPFSQTDCPPMYEMQSTVVRLLETPHALVRYLHGEDIFAGCARLTDEAELAASSQHLVQLHVPA